MKPLPNQGKPPERREDLVLRKPAHPSLTAPDAANDELGQVLLAQPSPGLTLSESAQDEAGATVRLLPPGLTAPQPVSDEGTSTPVKPQAPGLSAPQPSPDERMPQSTAPVAPGLSAPQPVQDEGRAMPVKPQAPALTVPQPTQDEPLKRAQYQFNEGRWLPGVAPLIVGAKNFTVLQNQRLRKQGTEGVQGYTKINTTALTTYLKIRSGIQMISPYTTKSRVLVQAYNTALTASQVLQNKTAIPGQGDFEAAALHTDAGGAGLGRFCKWPNNAIAYCNGQESMIWSGDEMKVGAFLTSTAAVTTADLTNPKDFTEQVNNHLTSDDQVAVITAATNGVFLIGCTRPAQAVKLYIKTGAGNTSASSLTGQVFTASGWAALASLTDNTKPAAASMAQTGTLTFTSTVATAKVRVIEGMSLYWYQFALSAGTATVYQVTVDAPFQAVGDVWDGTPILPASVLFYDQSAGTYRDCTVSAADYSELTYIALDDMTSSDKLLFGFTAPMMALKLSLSSDAAKVNANAATASVAYSNGDPIASWPACANQIDGTLDNGGTKCLNKTGMVSWTPPAAGAEYKVSINGGTPLYYYAVTVSATLSAAVEVWYATAVSSPSAPGAYKFPFSFLNRPMLCGSLTDHEGNRVDYAMTNAPEFWNGPDSSRGVDGQSLYFGDAGRELTCACETYNRLSSSIYSFGIFCKAYETYILNGYDPSTFRIYPISSSVGCPAPLTMDTYQIGISADANSVRSIAMWLSHAGPIMFDSGGLIPVPGIECYFDPTDDRCVNFSAIENARGWFDPDYGVYKLCIPSGPAQTTINCWLVYDLIEKKWYETVPCAAIQPYPAAAFRVEDEDGKRYVYGCRDNGYMMRLEDGLLWDGDPTVQVIETGEFIPSGDAWDISRLRALKVMGSSFLSDALLAEDGDILADESGDSLIIESGGCAVTHYADGDTVGTALANVPMNSVAANFRHTQEVDHLGWTHRLRFSTTVPSDSSEVRGMRLLAWGVEFHIERPDR